MGRFFCLLACTSFFVLSHAQGAVDYSVCPDVRTIPANTFDANISLEDVMHQFRDHLEVADQTISDGKMGSATDAELASAVDNVEAAHNCAELAVRNAKHTMIPDSIQSMPAAQQGPALDSFVQAMQQFADLLGKYETSLVALRDVPATSRNYDAASDLNMEVHAFEDQAHKEF